MNSDSRIGRQNLPSRRRRFDIRRRKYDGFVSLRVVSLISAKAHREICSEGKHS